MNKKPNKIKITKKISLDYAPPIGSVHEILNEGWQQEGIYHIEYHGKKLLIFVDECEVLNE